MNKSLTYALSAVGALLLLFLLNQKQQSKYNISTDLIFTIDTDTIDRISINDSSGDTLELIRTDTTWIMPNADTLILKQRQFDQLLEKVIGGKYDMMVSKNQEKWSKFGVTDSLGKSIRLFNEQDQLLAHYIFGNKGQDYSHNYVRDYDEQEVNRTAENVFYMLNTSPTYWGKNPPKVEPDKEEISIDTTSSISSDTTSSPSPF